MADLIAATALTEVFHHRGAAAGMLLVTFNDLGPRRDLADWWGRALAERLGVEAVGVVARRPHWFPRRDAEGWLPPVQALAIQALAASRPVVLYGNSMGGYAALRYAAALRAQLVLAFTPQFSLDPADLGEPDQRFGRFHDPGLHPRMAIAAADLPPSCDAFVVFDPADRDDRRHAALIAARTAAALVPVHGIGHDAVELCRGSERFSRLLAAAVANLPRAARARAAAALLRGERQHTPAYYARLARRLMARRHSGWAKQVLARGLALDPRSDRLLRVRSALREREGDLGGAVADLRRSLQRRPDDPHALADLARLLTCRGDTKGARDACERALRFDPLLPGLRRHLAALARLGPTLSCSAPRRWPRKASWRKRYSRCARRHGAPPEIRHS